jgi:hypothetical protein
VGKVFDQELKWIGILIAIWQKADNCSGVVWHFPELVELLPNWSLVSTCRVVLVNECGR